MINCFIVVVLKSTSKSMDRAYDVTDSNGDALYILYMSTGFSPTQVQLSAVNNGVVQSDLSDLTIQIRYAANGQQNVAELNFASSLPNEIKEILLAVLLFNAEAHFSRRRRR